MSWLSTPVMGISLWLILLAVILIAVVGWMLLNRQTGNKREAARKLAGRFGTAARESGAKTPVSPMPYVFTHANGVSGALTVVSGRFHLYLVDTMGEGDARLVTGDLLPKRQDGQVRSMSMRPLGPHEMHGESDYPPGQIDGPLTINQRLNVADKPREVGDSCSTCESLKHAVQRPTSPAPAAPSAA